MKEDVIPSPLAVPVAPGHRPLIGHGWQLWRRPLDFLPSLHAPEGMTRIDIGTWPVYFVTDPELLHQVLVSKANSFEKGKALQRARPVMGNGLATAGEELNRSQRRLIQPAFHHTHMARFARVMGDGARQTADSWWPGQRITLDRAMHDMVTATFATVLFSSSLSTLETAELMTALGDFNSAVFFRAVTPKLLERLPIPANRRFEAARVSLRRTIGAVIADRRNTPGEQQDLLAVLMAARHPATGLPMDDQQLHDEAITLLIGGIETTATSLAWAFHELARHPAVEQRVQAEADTVAGGGPVDYAVLPRLEYTSRFLNEVERLHAPFLLMRRAVTPVRLGATLVPAGTEVAFSPYALHHNPSLYPRPLELDPDRWLPEGKAQRSRAAFIPFGAGRHQCIGNSFAHTQMLVALAAITARWRLRPAPGTTVREKPAAAVPKPDTMPMITEARTPGR